MKARIAVRRSGVTPALVFGLLVVTASVRGQGLVEDFNTASGVGGGTVFSGSGYYELDDWDDNLLGEWAYAGTVGDAEITGSVDASGSTTAGMGGSGAGVLSVSGATFVDGAWFAGMFWPDITPPLLDPDQLRLRADVLGDVSGGAYQLRLEGYRLVPFGLSENFDTVVGSAGHNFFNNGSTGWMENWDEGISGEQAFAGWNGSGTFTPTTGGVFAGGVTNGGDGGSGAGQLTVSGLIADPGSTWYAGLAWPGQMLPTPDRTQVRLTAKIKGEINGGTLGDYMLRIEDTDLDFLAFKMTATGVFQDVGGFLSEAVEDGILATDKLFDPAKGPFSVVVVYDNDLGDTWGSGGRITVDNLELTGGNTTVLLGAVSFDGIADGSTFQPIGDVLSNGNSTLVNVNETFEDVVGPDASEGVFFDGTGTEGFTDNWDDGIKGEAAFFGIFGPPQASGEARATGEATGGAGGSRGGRLRVTGLGGLDCQLDSWWGGLSWAFQQMPDGDLANVTLLANVKGTAAGGGTAGSYTLRIEDADNDFLAFTLPTNGQFRTIGGALLTSAQGGTATEGGLGVGSSDGVFDRTHGPFTVVVAFEDACNGWGAGGQLDVDNLSLTAAAFGAGVETWSVAVSFIDEMNSWGPGGTLTVDNLVLEEWVAPLAPPPLVAVAGPAGSRYISFEAPAAPEGAGEEAIRVTMVSLDGYPLPSPENLWAGPAFDAPEEDSTQPGLTFVASPLSCAPHYQDWSTLGVISVYGAEIMPGSEYVVQRIDLSCPDAAEEGCYSEPLTITSGKYGDVWPLFEGPGNPPQPDFNDIAAVVQKFLATGPAFAPIKAVTQLQPNTVFPMRAIDFKDVAADVQAFLNVAYAASNPGPCACPSSVPCGVTACANDLVCGGGLCVGGFCADPCGRCLP